jgi:hypothetical protein
MMYVGRMKAELLSSASREKNEAFHENAPRE